MGNCYGKFACEYAKKQIGEPCGKSSKYAEEMDEISFYNFPKNGVANSCKIFVDNCVLHACTDPTYDEDPEGAKWTALYMVGEPSSNNDGAGCAQSVRMFQDIGEWYTDTQDFERGDEIYFRRNSAVSASNPLGVYHTGIIVDWGIFDEGEGFKVIEGNTNGGYVAEKFYPYGDKRIAGAGRPRYDAWEPDEDDEKEDHPAKEDQKPEPIPDDEPKYKEMEVCVNTKLRVRSGAGTAYPIIGLLPNGYIVNVYDEKDGWAKVDEYKEQWVSMDYLRDL